MLTYEYIKNEKEYETNFNIIVCTALHAHHYKKNDFLLQFLFNIKVQSLHA